MMVTSTPGTPVLQISKTSESFVAPGATLVYTISYINVGTGTATGVMVTETVPVATRFSTASSTLGWSCSNGSPAGTPCLHAVPDVPPNGMGTLLFAVVVDPTPSTKIIANNVQISDAEGGSSGGENATVVGEPAPAPAMPPWALAVALAGLVGVAARHLRRRPS